MRDSACMVNVSTVLLLINVVAVGGLVVVTACVSEFTLMAAVISVGVAAVAIAFVRCFCCDCCCEVDCPTSIRPVAIAAMSVLVGIGAWLARQNNPGGTCTATCRLDCDTLFIVPVVAGSMAASTCIVAIILAVKYKQGASIEA